MDPASGNDHYIEDEQMKTILQLQQRIELLQLQQRINLLQRQLDEQASERQRANDKAYYNPNFDYWENNYQYDDWSYHKSPYARHYNVEQPHSEWLTTFNMSNEPKEESTNELLRTNLARQESYIADSAQRLDKVEATVVGSSHGEFLETHCNHITQAVGGITVYNNPCSTQDEREEEDELVTTDTSTAEELKPEHETIEELPVASERIEDLQIDMLSHVGEIYSFQEVGAYCDPFLLPSKVAQENVSGYIVADQPHDPKIEWSTLSERQRYNSLGIIELCPTVVLAPLSAAKIDKMRRSWRRD